MTDTATTRFPSWQHLARITHFSSIKGKIFIVFAIALLSTGALTALNYWNLSAVMDRMVLSEHYDDLLNNILEMRRFEKNYLIYGSQLSYKEISANMDSIDALIESLHDDLTFLVGAEELNNFKKTAQAYRNCIIELTGSNIININDPKYSQRQNFRTLGKILTESAERYRQIKRKRIHNTLQRTSMLPFAFLAIVLLLMLLLIKLISSGLLRPLDVIRDMTGVVARGDFKPILYDGVRLEEVTGLIEAFNRMARELEANQEDLLQARKIAAIGTFTAGIAHELNNPINNIALTAESFGEEYGDRIDEDGKEMLRDILSQSERAADIVKNLLDFSRTESPTFECLQPARILLSTISLIKNQVHVAGLHLDLDTDEDLPCVRGNLRNLQQVFTNLLLNAIQATPAGGHILVSAGLDDDGRRVCMSVRDSGPGVPPAIRQQIFEPFFSTKEVGKGTGLGLAVSYSIVKRHGGRIEVRGEEGQGAEFVVCLPVSKERDGNEASERGEA
jgi:signal transduction histidine kinase